MRSKESIQREKEFHEKRNERLRLEYKEGVYYDRIGGNKTNPSNSEMIEALQRHYNTTVEKDIHITKTTSQMNGYDYYYIRFNFK